MADLKRQLLHLFYPNRCPVCGQVICADDDFCPQCREKLTPYGGGFTVPGAAGYTAAYEYDENISPAIILLKDGICGNADYALGTALFRRLKADGIIQKSDCLQPVPMDENSQRQRGFNQSRLICRRICALSGLPVTDSLRKVRDTVPQKSLNRKQRELNLRGAFAVTDAESVKGRRILLIDDVCTTGSTLAELTALLRESGAAAVYCASCCKTPPNEHENTNE